jgi:hypothetical protein
MPLVTVEIIGADEAKCEWDGRNRTLTSTGAGKWSGGFNAASGPHMYRVIVAGQPKDPWKSTVSSSGASDKVNGTMDNSGNDQSGKRGFNVP